ncbi:polysaccharide biosynthesis/export family protein [Egbenema bharatensis]|uniref:polysaccharide biosynthesis/export family protein n=1 Tax=Egbenema bharatensis TaxID=3463334 RepID=UPI003A88A760
MQLANQHESTCHRCDRRGSRATGPYRLGGEGGQPTLIQTIQQAGGFSPTADLRQIEVRRQTRQGAEQLLTVNLWDVLQSGDLNQDVVLQQGDRITVPEASELASEEAFALASSTLSTGGIQVNIIGEVRSAGQLELRANSTLNQAVLAAGGFNGRANRKDITLIRFNPNGTITEQELELDFSNDLNPENNPLLRNNDVILVGRSTGARITDTLSTILGVFQLLSPLRALPF